MSSVQTVYRACTPDQNRQDRANNTRVIVTTVKPEGGDEPVLYEIHAPEESLAPTDVETEFLFHWGDVDKYPCQVQHRG